MGMQQCELSHVPFSAHCTLVRSKTWALVQNQRSEVVVKSLARRLQDLPRVCKALVLNPRCDKDDTNLWSQSFRPAQSCSANLYLLRSSNVGVESYLVRTAEVGRAVNPQKTLE